MDLLKNKEFLEYCDTIREEDGMGSQREHFYEEMCEVGLALSHLRRGKGTKEQLLEELADLEQFIMTFVHYLGPDAEEYEKWQEKSMEKFRQHMKNREVLEVTDSDFNYGEWISKNPKAGVITNKLSLKYTEDNDQ